MMATKPKPSESSTSTIPTTSTSTSNTNTNTTSTMESIVVLPKSELPAAVTTEEREDALHQRLAALGATSDETTTTTTTIKPVAPNKNDKSALLARIMAAQERAKQAQQQQQQQQQQEQEQQQKKAPEPVPVPEPEPEPVVKEENHRKMAKQKMLDALSVKPTVVQPVFAPPPTSEDELKPPSFDAVEHTLLSPTNAPIVPPMHNTAPLVPPPPPPMMAPPMHTAPVVPPPPPPMMAPRMAEPSAPVLEAPKLDTSYHLQDIVPMAMAPPPSFADYEQQRNTTTTDNLTNWMQKISTASDTTSATNNNDVLQLDLEGNPMSAEERAKMMEEQRVIMEQIQKEKQANDAAIAAAKAENFEQRSAPGATANANSSATMVVNSNTVVEESQPLVPMEDVPAVTSRTVDIGGGQRVALQGQERTKAAIASGTALLVQCCNCQSWMQVTPTATLMYCPVCATVSPVIAQTDVATKDEAMQMTRDRQLAEQLQNEEYESRPRQRPNNNTTNRSNNNTTEETKDGAGVSSWFSSLTGGATTAAPATRTDFQSTFTQQQQEQKKAASWYDSFTSVFGTSTESTAAAAARSAEVKVTRPPSAGAGGGGLQEVRTGQETQHSDYFPESERLIGSHANTNHNQLQPARVAEKPTNPFSCVVDTVNSFGTTLTTGGTATRPNGNVHGINASPLLAVPNIGRNNNNNNNNNNTSAGGDYQRVPNGP